VPRPQEFSGKSGQGPRGSEHPGMPGRAAAVGLGAIFIAYAVQLVLTQSEEVAMRLFRYSITYLAALFAAMAVDAILA
jgi:heme O synthase-like polyprenyltransferase